MRTLRGLIGPFAKHLDSLALEAEETVSDLSGNFMLSMRADVEPAALRARCKREGFTAAQIRRIEWTVETARLWEAANG